jgi:hypothetical protein
MVEPLAFGNNDFPDKTKHELNVCVVLQLARTDVTPLPPGGRSLYDLVCVENVEFPACQ